MNARLPFVVVAVFEGRTTEDGFAGGCPASSILYHPYSVLRRLSSVVCLPMQRKVIISCAVTGSADTPGRNPAVPVTPEQIAQSSIDAAKAEAAKVQSRINDMTLKSTVEGRVLYRLAEELFIYIDQLSSVSAEGFAAEQAQTAGERQRRRRALAALLLHDPPPDTATVADAAEKWWRGMQRDMKVFQASRGSSANAA